MVLVVSSQFVQPSLAQNLSQLSQQAKEKIVEARGQLTDGNQTANQIANQSAPLGDPSKLYIPAQPAD